MNENPDSMALEKRGSILAPLGALAGALLGAVAWTALSVIGYMASIVGLLIAGLASKGYDLLGGKPGKVKIITLILCVILAVAAGTAGSVAYELHSAYKESSQELAEEYMGYGMTEEQARQFIKTEGEFFQTMAPLILQGEDEEMADVRTEIIKNFVMGLFFAALGSWAVIASSGKEKAKKRQKALPVEPRPVEPQPAAETAPQLPETPREDGKTDSFT